MALTLEQIKKLKPGDPLVINTTFVKVDEDGDIHFKAPISTALYNEDFISRDYVSILTNSQSKYAPTRPYKKGDIVTPTEVNGRHPGNRGAIFRVCQDEAESGREIKLAMDGHIGHITIDAAYLQLINPVEEQEPYSIDPENTNILFKYGKKFATFEDDDEAQEVCDRLNAEWRKEQENAHT